MNNVKELRPYRLKAIETYKKQKEGKGFSKASLQLFLVELRALEARQQKLKAAAS